MNARFTPWPEDFTTLYRDLGYWTGETFGALLDRLADEHGDRTAATDGRDRLSYRSLAGQSLRIAAGLHHLGIRRGDAVVLQAENTCQYLTVCFGLFRLGAVPVCALPAHREAEIGYFCRHTDAVAYLHPGGGEYERVAGSVKDEVATILTVGEAARLSGAPESLPAGPQSTDIALLQLSGGSTGVPKLIPRTHDDYLYSVRIAAEVCDLDSRTVYLCALPAAHNFPLSSPGVLGVLYAGGRVVMAPDPSPDTAFGLINSEQVTITAVVPALALLWMSAAERRARPLPSLEILQVGGARLDEADAKRVQPLLGARLQQVFGMAEGLVCYTRADDPIELISATQGRPASPHDEIRIVDDADNAVPVGQSGHLLTRGPYTIGYFRADVHNAVAFTSDGFYRTGDIVRQDDAGNLTVTGRAKDQVNRAGEKIAAAEIEEHLRAHPAIHDAALVPVDDPALGERSCAFCVPADGHELTGKAIRAFLRGRGLAAYKIPDLVRFTERLPRTPVGKVDKNQLKASLTPS